MKKIKLTQNQYALVDNEDFEYLNKLKWFVVKRRNNQFGAAKWYKNKFIYMHRYITNCPDNQYVDHINGNPLDNRKCNLRICTNSENLRNRGRQKNNKSGYKGVDFIKKRKKFRARITILNKEIHLGYFLTEIEAAKAYNSAAIKYHKKFANLNKIL